MALRALGLALIEEQGPVRAFRRIAIDCYASSSHPLICNNLLHFSLRDYPDKRCSLIGISGVLMRALELLPVRTYIGTLPDWNFSVKATDLRESF